MLSAVAFTHLLLQEHVRPGDTVIDATAGNGHDTLFLAGLVGPGGKVFAFDLQESAIAATRALLENAAVPTESYELFCDDHANLSDRLPPESHGRVSAVLFNLGYLPGGDKFVITHTDSSLRAVKAALDSLHAGGLLLVVLYPGHAGGAEEAEALREFAAGLSSKDWHCAEYHALNTLRPAPAVLAISRKNAAAAGEPRITPPSQSERGDSRCRR